MFGDKWKNNKNTKGFTIVEVMVVILVFVTVFLSILSFFSLDIKSSERSRMKLSAIAFCEEAMEAARSFRDNTKWSDSGIGKLTVNINYHPVVGSSGWDMVLGSENINGFIRNVVFYKVSRDGNDNIETSYNPINDDPNTRKVVVTVTWTDRQGETSETLSTYLTNWRE